MNPLTAYFGAGLGELGLSFNAVFPEQELGDELVLGVNLSEQDPETIQVASDFGKELLDYVINNRDRVTGALQSRLRSYKSARRASSMAGTCLCPSSEPTAVLAMVVSKCRYLGRASS